MDEARHTQEEAERLAEALLDKAPAWARPLVRELSFGMHGFEGDEDRRLPFNDDDLARLTVFPNLEYLDLTMTSVRDISPVAQMRRLKTLCLNENHVVDLTPLAGLPRLKHLHLAGAPVQDLTPLGRLPALQLLDLEETLKLKSLTGLEGARTLRVLNLHLSAVEDIEALRHLPALVSLRLHEGIDDLSPLRHLPSLRILKGIGPQCDLSPLCNLKLHTLSVTTHAGRLSPLAGLSSLRRLSVVIIGKPTDDDLRTIGDLAGLRRLFLACLPDEGQASDKALTCRPLLPDLAFLKDLKALRSLCIHGFRIGSPKGLRHAAALEDLDLQDTGLTDIGELQRLKRLKRLWLQDNPLTDLAPLRHLKQLEALDLARTRIRNLSPLRHLRSLKSLVISGTSATDLAPLKFLTRLEWLECNAGCRHAAALRHARRLAITVSEEGRSATFEGVEAALKAGVLRP